MSNVPSDWEVVIGLEVHVQLHTRAKVFASSPWGFGKEPNEQVDPVVLGLPGTLPVVNREAVEKAILFGLVVGAEDPVLPDVRVGIATGTVLTRMGDVFGSTVNLASRLTALAAPGTVLVDRDTADALA